MEPSERMSDDRNAVQREREWMASEIHDGLLQSVIAAHMMAESLRAKWPAAEAGEPKELQRLLTCLQHAMAEGRQLIDHFHSGPISVDDLRTALELLASTASDLQPVTVDLDLNVPAQLSSETLQTIYRVVQEALSNVRRHSQATRVEIRLFPHAPLGVRLVVADNGCGFSVGQTKNGHFGLESMRRRVETLGGQFAIESAPQAGTRITADLP